MSPLYPPPSGVVVGYGSGQAAPGMDSGRQPLARHHGLLGWAFDPMFATTTAAPVAGQLLLAKIMVPLTISVTNVEVIISAANVTPTAGQNLAALYDSTGAIIGAATADQSTPWGTTGVKQMALVGGPFSVTGGTDVFIWAAFLQQAVTLAQYAHFTNAQAATYSNMHLTAAQSRWGTSGTGQTAMPASFTPSAITQGTRVPWAGIS